MAYLDRKPDRATQMSIFAIVVVLEVATVAALWNGLDLSKIFNPPKQIQSWPAAGSQAATVAVKSPLQPLPSPEQRDPRPLGNPRMWVRAADYPPRDLREGNEGVTWYRLNIDMDGRVQRCTITKSSGFPGLDAATCRDVVARAKFRPATDRSGKPIAGSYSDKAGWVIPD